MAEPDPNEAKSADAPEPSTKRLAEHMENAPEAAAAPPRTPTGNTAMLSEGWQVLIIVGDKRRALDIRKRVLIGRLVENASDPGGVDFDLDIYDGYQYGVSREHAAISLSEGYLYLEDLGSTNGTRINGFQLTPHQKYRLRDGDEIEFSRLRTTIRFEKPDRS